MGGTWRKGSVQNEYSISIANFQVEVKCEKTGYYAEIEFLTKPFFGGKPHRIQGNIFKQGLKKPVVTLRGEWNGVIYAKKGNADEHIFTDVKAKPEVRKVGKKIVFGR